MISVAYIYANDKADVEQLSGLRAEFEKKGWAVSPDNRFGVGIRINGYKNENELFEILTDSKSTSGEAKKTNAIASVKKQSAVDSVRSHSLRWLEYFILLVMPYSSCLGLNAAMTWRR